MVVLLLFLICFAGNIFRELLTAEAQEVLLQLLIQPENISLNTTREKNNNCSYQILNGALYMNRENDFCQYDFAKKEWKTIWSREVYDYQIVGEDVHCLEFLDVSGVTDLWNIVSRNLNRLSEKEVLVEEVYDCVFAGEHDGIRIYNRKTCQWSHFKIDFNEINLYSELQDIQADEKYLYFQVNVFDTTKPAIAGPHGEKDADEKGI